MTAPVVATVDTLAGERLTDATLTVRSSVRLTCGCFRRECDRPGGGVVHVLVGEHCYGVAGSDCAVRPVLVAAA